MAQQKTDHSCGENRQSDRLSCFLLLARLSTSRPHITVVLVKDEGRLLLNLSGSYHHAEEAVKDAREWDRLLSRPGRTDYPVSAVSGAHAITAFVSSAAIDAATAVTEPRSLAPGQWNRCATNLFHGCRYVH